MIIMKVPLFVVVVATALLTGVETLLLQVKDHQQGNNNALFIKSTRQHQHQQQKPTNSDNNYRKICYYNNKHGHGRSLSSIQLFASSSSSSSFGSTVNNDGDDDGDDDNNNDDDDDEISSQYDMNRKQNRQWMIDKFQFPKERLNKNSHYYYFLTKDNSLLEERTNWLQDTLGLTNNEMNKIIRNHPRFLGMKIETNVEPTIKSLKKNLKLKKTSSLKKMVLFMPQVLGCKPDDIEPKLQYLQRRLNLDETQVGKIIMSCPAILVYSIENNLKITIDWLDQLGLTGTQVSKVIRKCPPIFTLSISKNLEPTVLWLKERLDVDDIQIVKMISRQPQFLGYSIETTDSKLEWIQNRSSITNSELYNVIKQQPSLLGYDVKGNLGPKIQFYVDTIETDDEDVLAYIARNPRLLTSSLHGRLHPRLEEVKEYSKKKIDIACLRNMAQFKEEEWTEWVSGRTA